MRERLELPVEGNSDQIIVPAEKLEKDTYERRAVLSDLESSNGEHSELKIAVSQTDGQLREANFWDLDKTLLIAEPIHAKAVEQIFPDFATTEEAKQSLHKVYFDGFIAGNSYREWDRMWRIYAEGQVEYKNFQKYQEDFIDRPEKLKLIDEPGHSEGYHERANEILQRYGKIAFDFMRQEYERDPIKFQKEFVKPEMMQLIEAKTRLGQANVYMTANQRDFARGLVTFSGLWKYGLALATDEDMAGGGKELAIRKLIANLETKGLKVNKERATAIGDSIKGDVGSGAKENLGSGIFVAENSDSISTILERAKDPKDEGRIASILKQTHVEAIPTQEVTKSKKGIFRFGKRSSEK
jgi:phosphoglycolate phosphatase-like HAD superfamily hydrolase